MSLSLLENFLKNNNAVLQKDVAETGLIVKGLPIMHWDINNNF